jgi:hypothetical protein
MAKLIRAYPTQNTNQLVIPGAQLTVSTTVTTGVIATALTVSAGNISNFTARFGSLYEEYRIVRVKFMFKCFSSTNPGLLTHWVDEKQSAAPTLAEAAVKSKLQFSASSPSPHVLTWTAQDPLDLQYIDIGTTNVTVCTYKVYSDNAAYGSSIVATAYGTIVPTYYIQFRGLN